MNLPKEEQPAAAGDAAMKIENNRGTRNVPVHANDEIGGLFSEFNEMSRALKKREEKLAEEKERLNVTLRSIGDAVIVTDVAGTVTLINKVAELLTGWTAEEAVGRPHAEVFPIINERTRKQCEHPVLKVIESGLANHTALIRKDGTEIIIEDSAAPIRDRASRIIGVVLVFRDATDKRRMEEELLKAEKLQAVRVLAGGLAHDFNNLLTAVLGNISMAKMYIDSRSKAFARLTEAESASRRATDLTYQLLTFSKGGAPKKNSLDQRHHPGVGQFYPFRNDHRSSVQGLRSGLACRCRCRPDEPGL
jgi:PAS domain S-box-containing protein